jgi:ABC-2 type transport system ATP-binding protein
VKGQNGPRIICDKLTKKFRNQYGLRDVSFDIEFDGLGLLGPNGSGKTTFLKILLGIINPTSGTVSLNVDFENIRVVSDQPSLPWHMTIDEWIKTIIKLHGDMKRNIDIQSDLGLNGSWKIKNLSAGQTRKVALLPAFYGNPELIILDEPTNFLDISSRKYILELLKEHIVTTDAKILISSHNLEEIRVFTNRVIILKEGVLADNIELGNENPEYYLLKADKIMNLSKQFTDASISHFVENSVLGRMIKVNPTDQVWDVVANYMRSGGVIHSISAMDELEDAIEEITK